MIVKKIITSFYYRSKIERIYTNYFKSKISTGIQKKFATNLAFFKANTFKGKENGTVLVQMVKDYEYTIKLAAASKAIAEKNNLIINFYEVDINNIKSKKNSRNIKSFGKSTLEKIYLSYGREVTFRNSDRYPDQKLIQSKLQEIRNQLDSKDIEKLLALRFDEIIVGDLIYDTYLRFFHKPTIIEIDRDVFHVIELALNLFYNFKAYIKSNTVKYLLNTYAAYIQHGIPARICLNNNINVYTIGSRSYILQKLSVDFPYHHINHTLFSSDKNLDVSQLEKAREIFTSRFEGKIDAATSYMKQSAYSGNPLNHEIKKLFSEKPRNIIIYAHDFYDSPHMNRMLQFPDFYQFLKGTLATLTELKNTTVFIKTHPNGIEGCKEKTIELVNSFNKNHFHILDESVSNLHIIDLKPTLIATARGTVCIEMAYFGIPSVALYDNSYVNFKFVHTCYDAESYFAILRGEIKPEIDFNKKKILSFYYQAFLEKTLSAENTHYNKLESYKGGDTYNDMYLKFILPYSKEVFSDKTVELYSKEL